MGLGRHVWTAEQGWESEAAGLLQELLKVIWCSFLPFEYKISF